MLGEEEGDGGSRGRVGRGTVPHKKHHRHGKDPRFMSYSAGLRESLRQESWASSRP